MLRSTVLALAALLAFAPLAAAGSAEAPEITDPAGDVACFGPAGNEWADIISAWIDTETEDSFTVHIALAKFTADTLATATGYTIQFSHQGVQFGAIAAYIPAPVGDGWQYDNGFIDTETGELGDFQDAEGSFTPGTPAIISIEFSKDMFPHGDSTDNKLVGFSGGSADFKHWTPFFVAPADPPVPFQVCDAVASSAEYVFQVGGHSQHATPSDTSAPTEDGATVNDSDETPESGGAVQPAATQDKDTPFAPVPLALLAVAMLALVRRRG